MDHARTEQIQFTRAPIDRLFVGCVLAVTCAYAVFMIVMQLLPREPEGAAKQSYLGVVSGESQPQGLGGGEEDPAAGTAARGGRRSAYYIGSSQAPRPVTGLEPGTSESEAEAEAQAQQRAPRVIPATRFEAGSGSGSGPGTSRLGKLGLGTLLLSPLEQLIERSPELLTIDTRGLAAAQNPRPTNTRK